jgi:hypothetical protein
MPVRVTSNSEAWSFDENLSGIHIIIYALRGDVKVKTRRKIMKKETITLVAKVVDWSLQDGGLTIDFLPSDNPLIRESDCVVGICSYSCRKKSTFFNWLTLLGMELSEWEDWVSYADNGFPKFGIGKSYEIDVVHDRGFDFKEGGIKGYRVIDIRQLVDKQ